MRREPPANSTPPVLGESEICEQCHSVSRLTNGLCLNCLLRAALDEDDISSGKEAFKEVLAGVKAGDGDWQIADHEILDEIARGGMGVVYQAREPHSGRIVALKCVLAYPGDSDHVVARFRREAETAARLEHPNIVPIYQVGETADHFPFYTMKFAAGGSLLQARGPLLQHPRQSAALMVKVARAVHYAHGKGVLHRDLKPGNILLDSHGEPLVSDFGLARCEAVASSITRSLASFGTPGYIAPEQADGPAANLTAAADIYSLGAILFELLTGRPPFVGDNAFAVMKQSAEKAAPKLRDLAPKGDRDLEIICARCLETEPDDRYQTAGELADDLQHWLDDQPIVATPPSFERRMRRWFRRNRTLASSLAALALLGAVSFSWQVRAQRIQSAKEESALIARSLVVLPFLDLDTIEGNSVVTEQVINSLTSQLQGLGSARISASSVPGWSRLEQIRKAAAEARVRAVLTGAVRNVGGKQRVSLRLLDPTSGQTLLASVLEQNEAATRFPRETEEWTRKIYEILSADDWTPLKSKTDPGLRNEAASDAMTSGRAWMSSYTVSDLERAIALFNKAIAAEPASSLAHSYLAIAATAHTHFIASGNYLEQGRAEAFKALQLAPDSMDAHRAMAGVYYQEGKFREALEEGLQTIEIGGAAERVTTFIGLTLDMLGQPDRALSWYGITLKLQAGPGDVEPVIGDCWAKLGDDDQAFLAYDRAIELQPNSSQGAVGKCHLLLLRGEFEAAREICRVRFQNLNDLGEMSQVAAQIELFARNYEAAEELFARLAKSDGNGGGSFYGAITYQSALGRIQQALGSHDSATKLLQESLKRETDVCTRQPGNPEAPYRLAAVEACLNLPEAALRHLHQAIALGWLDYRSLQLDPRFDSLRSNPELNTLIDGLSAKVADLRKQAKAR